MGFPLVVAAVRDLYLRWIRVRSGIAAQLKYQTPHNATPDNSIMMKFLLLLAFLSAGLTTILGGGAAIGVEPPVSERITASETRADANLTEVQPTKAVQKPLTRAHAHNDYLHTRPLLDALELGYCSIEADVFLVANGELWVAHEPSQLSASRTLENLYLRPLRRRVQQNAGSAFGENTTLLLWIDIKTEATATYWALSELLQKYDDLFGPVAESDSPLVQVIVSGNRDWETIAADAQRRAGIDGRVSDLDSTHAAGLLPFISDNWNLHFDWKGNGPMPLAERHQLQNIVDTAHRAGRRVRFWATPDNELVWQELLGAGVDLIGTDDLPRLRQFLMKGQQPNRR